MRIVPDAYVIEEWRAFHICNQIARARIEWDSLAGAPRDLPLNELLSSLLYMQAVSTLDEALDRHVGSLPEGYANLDGRLRLLRDRSELLDYDAINAVRLLRSSIVHAGRRSEWLQLGFAVATIERELLHLGVLDRPRKFAPR